ncbi:hypothetical protein ACXYMU_10670 [Pontibacter sp. CAU 1760]
MENTKTHSFKSLLQNPSQLTEIMNDPGKHGLEFYKNLSVKEQQYLLFAAAAGLIGYGIYIGSKKS